jgi:RHS repeat-associated protein
MFYSADNGLYLTRYRAYDPVASRWLSRDPAGEQSDAVGNLYPYVAGNPVNRWDSQGLQEEGEERSPAEEERSLEEDINPNVRGGLDYTPRPPQPAPPPTNACVPAAPQPPFSTRDTSGGWKGINSSVTADEFIANLQAQGYTARSTTSNTGPVTVLENGQGSTYTVYTRESTGESGAQYVGPIGPRLKYNLGR